MVNTGLAKLGTFKLAHSELDKVNAPRFIELRKRVCVGGVEKMSGKVTENYLH